ncbi:hypothetical protein ACL7TT_15130 [Microbulbifer sp. 2304DJ12-6]|uniref:hypothetical protein n=1 Tax=Microbulbifer sp. 2304DJ12-6 TaxID=3233340 RepID=UPI0039AF139E
MKTKVQALHTAKSGADELYSLGERAKMDGMMSFGKGFSCAVNNIAEEPDAVVPQVRICVGRLSHGAFYHNDFIVTKKWKKYES